MDIIGKISLTRSGAAKFEYRWKADFSCPCYIEYFDIRIYMGIFEFTWRQNHVISNISLFPNIHGFRIIYIRIYMEQESYNIEYIWYTVSYAREGGICSPGVELGAAR